MRSKAFKPRRSAGLRVGPGAETPGRANRRDVGDKKAERMFRPERTSGSLDSGGTGQGDDVAARRIRQSCVARNPNSYPTPVRAGTFCPVLRGWTAGSSCVTGGERPAMSSLQASKGRWWTCGWLPSSLCWVGPSRADWPERPTSRRRGLPSRSAGPRADSTSGHPSRRTPRARQRSSSPSTRLIRTRPARSR